MSLTLLSLFRVLNMTCFEFSEFLSWFLHQAKCNTPLTLWMILLSLKLLANRLFCLSVYLISDFVVQFSAVYGISCFLEVLVFDFFCCHFYEIDKFYYFQILFQGTSLKNGESSVVSQQLWNTCIRFVSGVDNAHAGSLLHNRKKHYSI